MFSAMLAVNVSAQPRVRLPFVGSRIRPWTTALVKQLGRVVRGLVFAVVVSAVGYAVRTALLKNSLTPLTEVPMYACIHLAAHAVLRLPYHELMTRLKAGFDFLHLSARAVTA